MFVSVRQALDDDQWNELLKALQLFTDGVLSKNELISLVADLFIDDW